MQKTFVIAALRPLQSAAWTRDSGVQHRALYVQHGERWTERKGLRTQLSRETAQSDYVRLSTENLGASDKSGKERAFSEVEMAAMPGRDVELLGER